jgi:hypothetical protein
MTIHVTEMIEDATLIIELQKPYDAVKDSEELKETLYAFHQRLQKPIYLISRSNFELTFSEMMISIATSTNGVHPMNQLPLRVFVIGEATHIGIRAILEAIAKGMYKGMDVMENRIRF